MASSETSVPLGRYLWTRIASLGIEHIFGVPGDFNLPLADYIYEVPALKWLGCCNELNGAYAADGYARIKGNPGALLTTYGPGELSALNGVAGAYAEHAGMIHIVGMPSRELQRVRPFLHHTLGPGMDLTNTFADMSKPVRTASTILLEDAEMASDIDRVILECLKTKRPVYIFVPSDVISSESGQDEDTVVIQVLDRIKASSNPAILVDVLTVRHGCQQLTERLVELTQFPTFSTPVGKGTISETNPCFRGTYHGAVSFDGVAEEIEGSDLVISVGPLPAAAVTGGFTRKLSQNIQIDLCHDHCKIGNDEYRGVHLMPVLKRLVTALEADKAAFKIPRPLLAMQIEVPFLDSSTTGKITQAYVWQRIGRFLQPHDMLFVEAGTPQFGSVDISLPERVIFNTQMVWSSIGYSVGAAFGGCVAARELNAKGRVILFVGEGSLQMTVQEIASFVRFGLDATIFVINNDGYSIERAIHGPKQGYNDLGRWDYQKMLEFFGAQLNASLAYSSHLCESREDVEKVLSDKAFVSPRGLKVCELRLDRFDYPWRLAKLVDINTKRAKKQTKELVQTIVNGA